MARRVQGEAKVRPSKQPPPTVLDMIEADLKKAADRYVAIKTDPLTTPEKIYTQRGILRGFATSYCFFFGSTPGQPKKDMISGIEKWHVSEARKRAEDAA